MNHDHPGYSRSVVSSYHREAAHVALGDGSVRRLNEQIDPQLLRALLTVDGSEPIPDWYQPR